MRSSLTSNVKVDFADSKRRRLDVVAAAAFTGSCLPEINNNTLWRGGMTSALKGPRGVRFGDI